MPRLAEMRVKEETLSPLEVLRPIRHPLGVVRGPGMEMMLMRGRKRRVVVWARVHTTASLSRSGRLCPLGHGGPFSRVKGIRYPIELH